MSDISINLLPIEFKERNLKNAKFIKIQSLGIAAVMSMFLLASVTVGLRILQTQTLAQVQDRVSQSEQKVSQLKDTQDSLYLLKNRLATINQYLGESSDPTQIYTLITQLLPQTVTMSSISVDRSSDVLILLTIPGGEILDTTINNLTSKEKNEGKISQVSIENINRGKDGIYRVSLKIKVTK